MADLTRFDFHVVRFLNSENVDRMTSSEIGQYLLLMCQAWLSNKEASLPDDPAYLSKKARVDKISPLVLSMFPVVETPWGTRRRNDTLYGEWLVTKERSEAAREKVQKRWGNTVVSTVVDTGTIPIPDQIIPNQSYQTNQTKFAGGNFENGNFKNISTRYRAAFRKDLARTKQNHEEYAAACNTYDESIVLEKFESWVKDNQWIASHPKGGNRLFVFLQALPAIIEGDNLAKERTSKKTIPVQLSDRNPFEMETDPDAPSLEFIEANKNRAF